MKTLLQITIILTLLAGATANAQTRRVSIQVFDFYCGRATDGKARDDRDEIYFLSSGAVPSGKHHARLPAGDDYYEWFLGRRNLWTNQDQRRIPHPTIWRGELKNNESATFVVHIGEQDNASIGPLLQWAANLASKLYPEIGGAAAAIIPKLPFPKGDATIGRVIIKVTNRSGVIVPEFHSQLNATKQNDPNPNVGMFQFGGDEASHYTAWFGAYTE
jgi:hypothetical protein